MNYIVLDMEWNQPWPGSPSSKKVLPVAIRGEIIQIGAVRVTEAQEVADEFQIMVKPKYYRHLNRRVSKLTGIKESRLREEGVPFPEAMEQFKAWCGEDIVFLTWGFDDIGILRENLQLHGLENTKGQTASLYNSHLLFPLYKGCRTAYLAKFTGSVVQINIANIQCGMILLLSLRKKSGVYQIDRGVHRISCLQHFLQ